MKVAFKQGVAAKETDASEVDGEGTVRFSPQQARIDFKKLMQYDQSSHTFQSKPCELAIISQDGTELA